MTWERVTLYKKDALRLWAHETRAHMGESAAGDIAEEMRRQLEEKDEINMIFAAAPSQNETLAALVKEDVDWTRVNAFHMDEYVGLEPGAPQSFGTYLREHIFIPCGMEHTTSMAVGDETSVPRLFKKISADTWQFVFPKQRRSPADSSSAPGRGSSWIFAPAGTY